MTPAELTAKLRIPVIGSPMFIVSGPELVIAQCKAGIVGSFPALNARPQSVLDEVVVAMNAAPGRVQVAGHTDSQASQDHNRPLSERRAESVRDYLVSAGIDADRIVTIGFGETRPIATNQNAEGRQRNRRTEFHVMEEN